MKLNDYQNDMHVVHSQTRTYHNGKEPYLQQKLLEQWLVESRSHGISVMENMSGVHADITFSTEEGPWSTVTTPYNSWIAPHCWQMRVATFSCAAAVFTRGVSLPSTSLKRLCRVLQFEEARRGSLEVTRGDAHHLRYCSVSAGDLQKTLC